MSEWMAEFIVETANVLSLMGSLWLIRRIGSLPYDTQRRVFPRQVHILALSDLVFHVGSGVVNLVGYSHLDNGIKLPICRVVYPLVQFGTDASAICVAHISLTFAFQAMRWFRVTATWSRCLVLVAPIGVICATCEAILYRVHVGEDGHCHTLESRNNIFITVLCIAFVTSLLSNAVIAVVATRSDRKSRGSWLRAAAYPINFLVSQSLVVYLALTSWRNSTGALLLIAVTLQNLNGFLNMVTYHLQSLLVLRLLRQHSNELLPNRSSSSGSQFGGVQPKDVAAFAVKPPASRADVRPQPEAAPVALASQGATSRLLSNNELSMPAWAANASASQLDSQASELSFIESAVSIEPSCAADERIDNSAAYTGSHA